ncbi:MAG: PQQ-binding-like beta-propeller repeat protein, partial [Verrucomicrobiales bacterium]
MDARTLTIAFWLAIVPICPADDWPQWRFDAGRTGATPEAISIADLHLQWARELPPLEPAFRDGRLQFDRGYEPIVLDGKVLIGSSRDDSVIALDLGTGELLWRYVSGGPIRFAPVGWEGNVYFGSDDGHLYCLDAADGSLNWKFRAVPSHRQFLGNGRLISTWPVRGGPVLRGGRIYFAAGVWSFEGVFVYALDAKTGEVVWLNDKCGYIYGSHPHNAVAFGGLAPQGYLLINGDELVVPSSSAYPARFELETGKLIDFQLPAAGRKPGGWFVATGGGAAESKLGLLPAGELARKRELLYERDVNRKQHEGKLYEEGGSGVQATIWASDQQLGFNDTLAGIDGTVHSMLVANGRLILVTEAGELRCYGTPEPDAVIRHSEGPPSGGAPGDADAVALLKSTGADHGFAVFLGLPDLDFIETVVSQSSLKVVVLEPSADSVASARDALVRRGCYGDRVAIQQADPMACELPPYFADLIVGGEAVPADAFERIARSVRPFGGKLVVPRSDGVLERELPGFQLEAVGGQAIFIRKSLPGSTNYTGGWAISPDELVRAPLGVLWFDDTLGHFKRSPQPSFVDGVMVSVDKIWADESTRTEKEDYRLKPAVYSDVYTGRVLEEEERPLLSASLPEYDLGAVQPKQYRPPTQRDAWKPDAPAAGLRTNPLTGEEEPRVFPKSYGCDGGFDYGKLYTMRSGTASFYDKRIESGTINLSGPRSGCTNSVIPANGVLNVPYFYEGCTCSYPLPTALALVSMPETHEQWASWGDVSAEALEGKIHRLGINFGAPGDRMTDAGTLWLDYPNVGGGSPQVRVEVTSSGPSPRYEYCHSLRIKNGSVELWPWVAGSAVIAAENISVQGLMNGAYELKLSFAELAGATRKFSISVQGEEIRSGFDPAEAAGGEMRGVRVAVDAVQVTDGKIQ